MLHALLEVRVGPLLQMSAAARRMFIVQVDVVTLVPLVLRPVWQRQHHVALWMLRGRCRVWCACQTVAAVIRVQSALRMSTAAVGNVAMQRADQIQAGNVWGGKVIHVRLLPLELVIAILMELATVLAVPQFLALVVKYVTHKPIRA